MPFVPTSAVGIPGSFPSPPSCGVCGVFPLPGSQHPRLRRDPKSAFFGGILGVRGLRLLFPTLRAALGFFSRRPCEGSVFPVLERSESSPVCYRRSSPSQKEVVSNDHVFSRLPSRRMPLKYRRACVGCTVLAVSFFTFRPHSELTGLFFFI